MLKTETILHNNMKEINKDIFEWIEENKEGNVVILMHCISSDVALGAGIAKVIDEKYQERERILRFLPEKVDKLHWDGRGYGVITPLLNVKDVSSCFQICNLVTKEKYWQKPTYTSLFESLKHVKPILKVIDSYAKRDGLKLKIVMPKIGCGLDKLNWIRVKEIVTLWAGLDFDITVCYL